MPFRATGVPGHTNRMSGILYHVIVLAVALIAVARGFRNGLTRQVSGVLGFAFGVVSTRVLSPEFEHMLRNALSWIENGYRSEYIYSIVSCGIIYLTVSLLFRRLTGALRNAMEVFDIGILDSLTGAVFCVLEYLMIVSIALNLIICVNPESTLMHYAKASDGNIVEGVAKLSPALLGSESVDDLAHIIQLHEASRISCNQSDMPDVIIKVPHPES